MAQDHKCNCFGQRLISSMRAAALPAVLGMLWHAPCVAQELQKAVFRPLPFRSANQAILPTLPANLGARLSLKLRRRSTETSRHWFTSRSKPSRSPYFLPTGSVTNIGPIMEPCPAR